MEKVNIEVAEAEIKRWLDYKKIGQTKQEANKDNIKSLAEAISEGVIRITEEFEIIHTLKFPIKEEIETVELKYKPRISVKAVHQHMVGVKSDSGDGRILAYVAVLTGKAKGVLLNLDSEDYSICMAIAIFFL
jgi:hypothetical protein